MGALAEVTNETMDLIKSSYGNDISKSITTASGLVAYDLQAPAKNLYPVYTPLRNKIPRTGGGKGVATNWRTVKSITGSGFDTSPWLPEGQRSGRMSYATAPKAANYVTLGEEDSVTFEATNAGQGFEDVRATMTARLLQKFMLKEENAILGGNATLQLGTPSAPTVSASGTGGTLAAATYSVIVVALTQEGFYNSNISAGVATTKTVTGADGQTYVLNGGSSNKSANATQAVTLGQSLVASVSPVIGAVGYAWFVGAAGSESLQAITTVNSAAFSAPLAGGRQAVSAITGDCSANPGLAFDGLLSTAFNPANSAYVSMQPTGNAGVGTPLTAGGRGNVVEIDAMLKNMWDGYNLSPTVIYANSQEIKNITDKVMATASGTILRMQQNTKEPYAVVANGVVSAYYNPFMPNGGQIIPIIIHPKVPPGTLIGWCEDLPIYYQNNEVQNVAEIKTRQDYYQIDWPVRTRQYETGVYAEEVLAIYAPFAMGIIGNIANG
ncbi:hypothetical protein [Paludibacterium purpuratum]|uniref:Uncharacterized protein n=1 Tax=Paludibacterium purpuratum TaxID=1144873 RepID=A0A4R7BB47_9NEIS|nr:hypothetical protein [Paludibacterium purpuratum]TDR82200.1 hypothetical protein DFP86_102314 [Paludibacterium purpuratum]